MNRPLESEQTYILSFEAYADKPRTISARLGQGYEPWTLHHQEYFTLQKEKQSYTMAFKMPATPDPTSYIEFAMGGRLGSNPPFRVCFDNVSLQKDSSGNPPAAVKNVLGNPAFDDTVGSLWQGWFDGAGGSQGLSAISNGEFCIKVTNGGANAWGAQVLQREFPLEANQTYTLSFEAHADQAHTIHTRIALGYEPWTAFHEQDFDIGQEKQSYTLSFTMPATGEGNSGLEFWMGGDLATNPPFTVCFDNISLQKTEGEPASETQPVNDTQQSDAAQSAAVNLLSNPNFDDPSGTSWGSFFPEAISQGSTEVKEGEYCVTVTQGGTELWHSQFYQRGFALEANQAYTVSFEAYADQPRTLHARAGQGHEPWLPFYDQNFDLGQQKQSYTYSFTTPETAEPNGDLSFWMGGEFATNPPFTMCFDNISLKADVAAATSQ
jgi:Carbohydrate binding domain